MNTVFAMVFAVLMFVAFFIDSGLLVMVNLFQVYLLYKILAKLSEQLSGREYIVAKKSKRKKLTDRLDGLCREIIRTRDGNRCQKCNKPVKNQNAHCSHVIPRSRGNALRWDLLNLKLLCFFCHIFWWHKDILSSAIWFKEKYPVRFEYLEKRKREIKKFTTEELEDLYYNLQKKLDELKNKKM